MARHGENIRKRKDGRWEARMICGYREDGRARYKSIYRKTYAEVKAVRNQMMLQMPSGGAPDAEGRPQKTSVAELLAEWLSSVRQNVKESTYSRYQAMIEKHIRPELGALPLGELSEELVDRFVLKKLRQGNLKSGGGLSPKTVTGLLSVIRLALEYGTRRGYGCLSPVMVHNPRQSAPKIQVFTPDEQRKLESVLLDEDTAVSFGILVSLYMGLRIGEVCGLRWGDFDGENGILYVGRSVQRIPNLEFGTSPSFRAKTKLMIDVPKTDSSLRQIPVPSFLLPIFKRHQTESGFYILTAGPVCPEPRAYYRKYKKLLEKCGLERFNYHALRHTFATRCVENDFDVKSLSEILGHANISTTLQRYVHPSLGLKRRHMDRLETIAVCGQKSGQNG